MKISKKKTKQNSDFISGGFLTEWVIRAKRVQSGLIRQDQNEEPENEDGTCQTHFPFPNSSITQYVTTTFDLWI